MNAGYRRRLVRVESELVVAVAGPVPLGVTLLAMSRQSHLAEPAKFAVDAEGLGCAIAEFPRIAPLDECAKWVGETLDGAFAWLDRGCRGLEEAVAPSGFGASASETASEIECGLDELPWRWERTEEGSHRVHADSAIGVSRVAVECAGGAVRASISSAVGAEGDISRDAQIFFALEANHRLRLARVSVVDEGGDAVRVIWDAVAPSAVPIARAVSMLTEAVVFARGETGRALTALCDPCIAEAYLDHRFPIRDRLERSLTS